jgi:hypothetical protein
MLFLLLLKSYYSFDAGGPGRIAFGRIKMLRLKQKVEDRAY